MDNLLTGLVAILASVVGGLFTMWAVTRSHQLERTSQTEHEKQTSERVRTMLSLEIEQNLAAFEKYDAGIDERILFQNSRLQPKERAQQLSDIPLPEWKHDYWEGLTAQIPTALTPDEIRKCHEFHSRLKELTRLCNFSRTPQGTWHQCMEQEIANLKGLKNPLHS
jgi:nitrogen fixation-related uncharacterized protein